jgi:hypothetical protein
MNRYWLRIGLGMVLVFVLGVSAMAAVRKGKEEVGHFLSKVSTRLPLQLANLKFRFEGRTIGEISGIDVQRNGPDDPGRVNIRVDLAQAGDLEALRECALTADDLKHIDKRFGFRCADQAELDADVLVKSGEVTFEPGSVTRPLLLFRHDVERWQRSDIQKLDASLATDDRGGVRARGNYDVRSHDGPERGSFTLEADSQGAVISVKDESGRSLVDFRADHKGVKLNITDGHGRNLMRMLADSLGAALKVRKY